MNPVNLKDYADGASVLSKPAGDWLFDEAKNLMPMIVWTNKARIAYIRKVRKHFRYTDTAHENEPVVIRENKNGMVNNETGVVFRTAFTGLIEVDFGMGKIIPFKPFLEDIEEFRPKRTITTRFAYAITAHTSQGGEWDRVLVDLDSYKAMAHRSPIEARRWLYTAVTRAKQQLIIVRDLHKWLGLKNKRRMAA